MSMPMATTTSKGDPMANVRLNSAAPVVLDGSEEIAVVKKVAGVDTDGTATVQAIADLATGGGGGGSPVGSPSATVTASRSLAAGDAGKFLYCDHASSTIVVTVPADAGMTIPLDAEIHIRWQGVAAVSLLANSGATITKPAGQTLSLSQRYSVVTIKRKTATEWALFGDLGAAP